MIIKQPLVHKHKVTTRWTNRPMKVTSRTFKRVNLSQDHTHNKSTAINSLEPPPDPRKPTSIEDMARGGHEVSCKLQSPPEIQWFLESRDSRVRYKCVIEWHCHYKLEYSLLLSWLLPFIYKTARRASLYQEKDLWHWFYLFISGNSSHKFIPKDPLQNDRILCLSLLNGAAHGFVTSTRRNDLRNPRTTQLFMSECDHWRSVSWCVHNFFHHNHDHLIMNSDLPCTSGHLCA